eukprot:TRINITY_DN30098_c0_g1_i1.p1 TRINITY_DN30098_c0_g1~~TRINITY_DN30098_c0_g1_i1.p1  ORF type:complete len:843 (+),score=385.75 TRINITY_DN30098_c0_g1_i1:51-2579(+)
MSGRKAFVSHVDSHLGKVLCKKLAQQNYEVRGTLGEIGATSAKFAKVVDTTDVQTLKKSLLDADVVVYQLEDSAEAATAALKVLMSEHYEVEKTFVLVSSLLTWFETETAMKMEAEQDDGEDEEGDAADDEPKEQPTYTEEEYSKRVPHVKYQLWKEVEKLCKRANSETLHTYCVFGGLQYGLGEDKLHPIFKQAWHLAEEGLPLFAKGDNVVPTVHVSDLASLVLKLGTADAPFDQRYYFGVDEGNCSWKTIIGSVNQQLGNGKTFAVPTCDYVLYENVEQFTINLKVELGKMGEIVEEEEWVSKAGFVENAANIVQEFKEARGITPLRAMLVGPPVAGKSFYSRELAKHYRVPCYSVFDIIKDYEGQMAELTEELQRLKFEQKEKILHEKLKDLRAKKKEEAAAAAAEEAAGGDGEDGEGDAAPPKEVDKLKEDSDEDELFDDDLLAELEKNKEDGAEEPEEEETEQMLAVKEQLAQVTRVLQLKEKVKGDEDPEPANPKDKKKGAAAAKPPPPTDDAAVKADARYSDRCLAYMIQWKLSQPQSKNQGYILDGYPKTVKQARLLFEEGLPGDLPAEGEEDAEEPELEEEKKPVVDGVFPDYLLHLKASDTYLTERVQKLMKANDPHNEPMNFQKRLEFYKVNNPSRDRAEPTKDASKGLVAYLESVLTNDEKNPRSIAYRLFDVESAPLEPPPPPESKYERNPPDKIFESMASFVGPARNYGPTPQAIAQEQARLKALEEEQKAKRAEAEHARRADEKKQKEAIQEKMVEEQMRMGEVKAHERAMLEARKGPLKQYLMTNIIPVLTKGIIEVCEQRPDDPIDYLADWLFRHNPVDDDGGI